MVNEKLLNLDPHKAPGPDNIPPILLQKLANDLAAPITKIFQMSMDEGLKGARGLENSKRLRRGINQKPATTDQSALPQLYAKQWKDC